MSLRQQIYLNGTQIELAEAISIPRTYSVADVREPQKRSTSYSKTVIFPGTKNNNILFAHLFDLHTTVMTSGTTTFNPNLKKDVSVIEDGCETFKGYLQLNHINVINDYSVEYECTMFGNLANIFQTLGDSRLSQLDLSAYDHVYNKTNQVNSWDTSIQKNGANFVNFSGTPTSQFVHGLPTGEGYVYPMIDYGYTNGTSYDVNHFFPAIYTKTIIDAIFNQAGFQYVSQFFNSSVFKQDVIPFGGTKLSLTNAQAKARGFMASNNVTAYLSHDANVIPVSPYAIAGIASFQDETTSPNWDTGGVYNNSTFKFTAPKGGTYKIDAQLELSLTHFPTTATVTYLTNDFYSAVGSVNVRKNGFSSNSVLVGMNQGATSNSGQLYNFNFKAATLTSGTTNCAVSVPISWQGYLNSGDIIDIYFASVYSIISPPNCGGVSYTTIPNLYKVNRSFCSAGIITSQAVGYTRININNNSYFKAVLADTKIVEGDTLSMNNVLPDNVKQADFLMSIIKAYNLYIDNDKSVSNKLIIEPRDTFYSSGTTRDWSQKLDYSQPLVITPMGELDSRTYVFTYKEDSDYYNDTYWKKWREVYGFKRYAITNDFIKNEDVTELIFSPTPLADYVGIDRVISKIFAVDSSGQIQPKTSNLRLLYYGGVFTTNNGWSYVATSGTTTYNTYPYAGHLDSVASPTLDLNFEVPREVYYTASNYTNNNLFNLYWKNHIDEITDKDSKLVMGYFKLNAIDIANLSFFDVFYFENDLFKLNKIYDYDPSQQELTKCEFIKLLTYPAFVAETQSTFGGFGTFANGSLLPLYSQRTTQYNNYINGVNPIGQNNFIATSAIGCSIRGGTNSVIGEGCQNVSLINTSGVTVNGGVQNVGVINTSGVTVSASNQVIVNGFVQADPLTPTTYTPTLTNVANCSSTAYQSQYLRVGNTVTVSGQVDINPDVATTSTSILMTLPVTSVFASANNCGGIASAIASASVVAGIYGDVATGTAKIQFISTSDVANITMYFTFTYTVL